MKKVALLLTMISLPAFSCPDLSGVYKNCRNSNLKGSTISQVSIDQSLVDDVNQIVFTIRDSEGPKERTETYMADGLSYTTTDHDQSTGVKMQTATKSTCSGPTLTVLHTAKMDSQEIANMKIETTKSGKSLTQKYSGHSLGAEVNEMVVCD